MSQVVPTEQIGKLEHERQFRLRIFNLFTEFNKGIDMGVSTQTGGAGALNYTGNLNGRWANVTAPGAPNTEFSVNHELVDAQGNPKIPSFYFFISDRACRLYQLPNTGTPWTTTKVYLKCDTASAVLRIFVI